MWGFVSVGSDQKWNQVVALEHGEQIDMLTYKKCLLIGYEYTPPTSQSLFLHVILALFTSFRNITASVKKACYKPPCVGTDLNFPKMWVVWTPCFSLLTPTESGPGINQLRSSVGNFLTSFM